MGFGPAIPLSQVSPNHKRRPKKQKPMKQEPVKYRLYKLRTYIAATFIAVAVTLISVSLLHARDNAHQDTVTDCRTYFERCVAYCNDNDANPAECRSLCYRNLDNCVTNATAHASRPPIHVPSGPIETLPNAGTSTAKSSKAKVSPSPRASRSATPTPTPNPSGTPKTTGKRKGSHHEKQ